MRFTAEFDSPDSADICAAAVRSRVSGISSVKTESKTEGDYNKGFVPFPINNGVNGSSQYLYNAVNPFYTIIDIDSGKPSDYIKSRHIIDIVCGEDDERAVSNILVGFGGMKIRKT